MNAHTIYDVHVENQHVHTSVAEVRVFRQPTLQSDFFLMPTVALSKALF